MTTKQAYICFDTNIYVHCALTNVSAKMNTGYLRQIFKSMDEAGVKLLVPEVVHLELRKVLDKQVQLMAEHLGEMQKEVEADSLLGWKTRNELVKTIKQSKKTLREEADTLFAEFEERANNPELSVLIPFSDGDIVNEAIRLAIRGESPAANDKGIGLLQGDCLIASTIRHFTSLNPEARVVLCSDNIDDFAKVNDDGKYVLNDCLAEYLPEIEYCRNPSELYGLLLDDTEDKAEIEPLEEEYERVATAPRYTDPSKFRLSYGSDYPSIFGKSDQGVYLMSKAPQTPLGSIYLDQSAQSAIGSSYLDPSVCSVLQSRYSDPSLYPAMAAGRDAVASLIGKSVETPLTTMVDLMKDGAIRTYDPNSMYFANKPEGAIYVHTPQSAIADNAHLTNALIASATKKDDDSKPSDGESDGKDQREE